VGFLTYVFSGQAVESAGLGGRTAREAECRRERPAKPAVGREGKTESAGGSTRLRLLPLFLKSRLCGPEHTNRAESPVGRSRA